MEETIDQRVLNFTELLTGLPNQLRYIKRFSNCRAVVTENVAEHSYYVALISMFIAEMLNLSPEEKYDVLRKAIIHDFEELFTGDIIHNVKHTSNEVNTGIHSMAASQFLSLIHKLTGGDAYGLLIFGSWLSAKDSSIAGRIVSFADYASAVAYVYEEVMGGNIFMLRNVDDLLKTIEKFNGITEYGFLHPLRDQLWAIIRELEKKKELL